MKILRLSFFNIKKHKTESISLFILLLISMVLLASSVSGISGIDKIIDNAFEKTGGYRNFIKMDEQDYKDIYLEFLENDERVESAVDVEMPYSEKTKYINKNGDENTLFMGFINLEDNAKIEKLVLDSSLTQDEILSKKHFIIMPYYMKDTVGYREGDTFVMVCNEKSYPFEVVGFYETGFFADTNMGMKMIVSDLDFNTLGKVFPKVKHLFYNLKDKKNSVAANIFSEDFLKYAEENAIRDETQGIMSFTFDSTFASSETVTIRILMYVMTAMAVVVFAAVVFMVGHRIKNDIDEQVVAIGVLEALGYKSGEISLSYVLEYLIISIAAIILGLFLCIFTVPLMGRIGEFMTGHYGSAFSLGAIDFLFGLLLILFVSLVSFFSARRVKKFPPVVAFRKGIENHSHKTNILPLEKTKINVHLRLAAKGFFSNMKTNIGMGLCIGIAVIALVFCVLVNGFLGNGIDALIPIVGLDLCDVRVEAMTGTDVEKLSQDILKMNDVRKVNITNDFFKTYIKFKDYGDAFGAIVSYNDFKETENIKPTKGRFPIHDNECMITESFSNLRKKKIGDSITLRVGKMEADYIICGLVASIINGGGNVYMTDNAYKKLNPSFYLNQINIFLNEGVDKDEFKKKLFGLYGTPGTETEKTALTGTLSERIQAEAERKIGVLLEMYDVDSIDYAIQIGDEMITGSSSKFKIRSGIDLMEILVTQTAGLFASFSTGTVTFMVISIFVIAIIIFLIVLAAVKKQRRDFGILRGMGYTSNELMIQMAARIVPTLVIAVIIGSILGIYVTKIVLYAYFGNITFSYASVVVWGIFVCVFGFLVAYFSARKIKNISVYELMQE